MGESQSAFFLTTYVNAVDALDQVYDGFLVHSRFGPAAPLDGGSIFEAAASGTAEAVTFRDDLRVPLMTVITETDLCGGLRLGYHRARQPDTEHLRTWEIPGTAHADNYTIQVGRIDTGSAPLDDILAAYAPTDVLMGQQLPHAINFAPQHHYVLQAALDKLVDWVRDGRTGPGRAADRIERRRTGGRRSSTPTGSRAAACAPRGSTCPSPGPPGSAPARARWRSSSAPVNSSTTPPCAGSTPVASPNTSNASPRHSTRPSEPASSCPPTEQEILELASAGYPGSALQN